MLMGAILTAGQGQAPARQGRRSRPGCRRRGARDHRQQDVRLRHEDRHDGRRRCCAARRGDRRRRHGEHVEGALPRAEDAPGRAPRSRRDEGHMFLDGLEDAYDRDERGRGRLMGVYAEATAEAYQFTRAEQDAYALESLRRARTANEDGSFAAEIAPVEVNGRAGKTVIARDEQPFTADPPHRAAEARVPRGWHGDGGQFELDFRRRRFARADARASRRAGAGSHRSPASSRPPATRRTGLVHDGSAQGDRQGARCCRLEQGRRRPLRGERGVRRRADGGDARPRDRTRGSTCTAAPALGHPIGASARASSPLCRQWPSTTWRAA